MFSFATESSLTPNKLWLHNQPRRKAHRKWWRITCAADLWVNLSLLFEDCGFSVVAFRCTKEWSRTAALRLASASSSRSPFACPTSLAAWTQRATTSSHTRWGAVSRPSGCPGWARGKPPVAPRRSEASYTNVPSTFCCWRWEWNTGNDRWAAAGFGTRPLTRKVRAGKEASQISSAACSLAQWRKKGRPQRFVTFERATNEGRYLSPERQQK